MINKLKEILESIFTPIFLGSLIMLQSGAWYIAIPLVLFDLYITFRHEDK